MQTLHKALIFAAVIFLCVPGTIHGFGINIASIPSLRSSPASVSKNPIFASSPLTPQRFPSLLPLRNSKDEQVPEASEETEASAESVEASEEQLDTDSKEFLQRKVEILQKELDETSAKLQDLEADAKSLEDLKARGILKLASAVELKETYIRLAADFENYRKRTASDLVRANDMATVNVVKELLVVLDTFERAGSAIKCETDREQSINNSYQAVNKELLKVLNKLNVEAIEPLGQEFDPNMHNAIQQLESKEYKENVVCQALQRGYKIGDRVVRPALVVVSSGPGPEESGEETSAPSEQSESSA
ncbi:GrpE nucleotide exchange factor, chloroplastic, partial [Guillardia theta CCMP2712]